MAHLDIIQISGPLFSNFLPATSQSPRSPHRACLESGCKDTDIFHNSKKRDDFLSILARFFHLQASVGKSGLYLHLYIHKQLNLGDIHMSNGKWIGGTLGFVIYGPLGALAGFLIGSIIDGISHAFSGDDSSYGPGSETSGSRDYYQGQRNSLLFSLLVMASYVIRADKKIMHSEMEYVRSFLRNTFGSNSVKQGEDILKSLFEKQKEMDAQSPGAFKNTIRECAQQISVCMPYEQRLQLLAFLINIAKADGKVVTEEIDAVREIAQFMGMSQGDIDSMLNLGGTSLEAAYKVLEIEPTATDDEVRRAYKAMALKHHPDKVAMLGDDIKQAAEQKFKEIGQAKDIIFKSRGIN